MNKLLPQAPVGMESLVSAVTEICNRKQDYRLVSPVHFIVHLDAGNGQTTATRYISEALFANDLIRFGGLEQFIEFKLDGTLGQMKKIFTKNIPENAVYTNMFEGVISFDITSLSSHSNEMQTEYFIAEVKKLSVCASMIFYIGSSPSPSLLSIARRIRETVHKAFTIHDPPYSVNDFAMIIERGLKSHNIKMEPADAFHVAICEIIKQKGTSTVMDALKIMEEALVATDYSNKSPILWIQDLQGTFSDCHGKEKSRG